MIEHAPIGIVSRPKDLRRHATALFAFGSALGFVGSLLPWLRAPLGTAVALKLGPPALVLPGGALGEWTALHGDGALTAAIAGVGLAVGLVCTFYRPGRKPTLFGLLLVSVALLFIGGTVWSRIAPPAAVALGLELTVLGGAIGAVSTVFFTWALGRAPPESMEGSLPIVPG